MPETFTTLAVLALALLPGGLYAWSYERIVGRWGSNAPDRLLRFVASSAILHAVAAPLTWWLWESQWPIVQRGGTAPSWWLWPAAVLYVVVPFVAGHVVGHGTRRDAGWARWLTGPDPVPRAWDHLFRGERQGWIRIRLKSGSWIAGAYGAATSGERSYAAGYPEQQDLYLSTALSVDPVSGEFHDDGHGGAVILTGGLLVRWEEVEYLEFISV